MTKFSFSWPRRILMCSLFINLSAPWVSYSQCESHKSVYEDDIWVWKSGLDHFLSKCHFNFNYEFGGERFRSISWLLGGCTLVCGIFLSGVFHEGGSPPPGPEKGPEGSSRGGPGCPTPEGSYWVFSNRVISLSSSSPNSPPIKEGSPTTITSWDAREKLGRGEPPFFKPIPAAAADEPFLFLLLLAGLVASGGATIFCHFWNKVVLRQSRGLRA